MHAYMQCMHACMHVCNVKLRGALLSGCLELDPRDDYHLLHQLRRQSRVHQSPLTSGGGGIGTSVPAAYDIRDIHAYMHACMHAYIHKPMIPVDPY